MTNGLNHILAVYADRLHSRADSFPNLQVQPFVQTSPPPATLVTPSLVNQG